MSTSNSIVSGQISAYPLLEDKWILHALNRYVICALWGKPCDDFVYFEVGWKHLFWGMKLFEDTNENDFIICLSNN